MGCTQRDYEIESEKIIENFKDWLKEYGNERIRISEVIEAIESMIEEQKKMGHLYHGGRITEEEFDQFNMLHEDFEEYVKRNGYIRFGEHKGQSRIWPFMTPEERYREEVESRERKKELKKRIEDKKKQGKSGLELLF